MNRSIRTLLIIAALAATAGCSSGGGMGPRVSGGGADDALREVPNLFISPAGQPFRAGRDQPYPVTRWFTAADSDHDGRLTRSEFRADAATFFDAVDTDHNGIIDGFEVQHYEREIAPEINPQIEGLRFGEGMDLALGRDGESGSNIGRSPAFAGREQAGDRRAEGAGVFGLLDEPEPVAATDTRFDGHITREEFIAAADRRFDSIDKKKLGYLTLETLPKTPAQRVIERLQARRAKQVAAK